jgi:hypothetical protein
MTPEGGGVAPTFSKLLKSVSELCRPEGRRYEKFQATID